MNAAASQQSVDTCAAFGSVPESHLAREALYPWNPRFNASPVTPQKAERFNGFSFFQVTRLRARWRRPLPTSCERRRAAMTSNAHASRVRDCVSFLTKDNKENEDCSFVATKGSLAPGFLLFKTFSPFRHNLAPDFGQNTCERLPLTSREGNSQ